MVAFSVITAQCRGPTVYCGRSFSGKRRRTSTKNSGTKKIASTVAEIIPVCPEVLGGLRTPRTPAEIRDERVVTKDGRDVTEEYVRGAEETLQIAREKNCRRAVLKERSPSCGSGFIYDGTFSKKLIPGDGITVRLLKKRNLPVPAVS